jgi:hypothetical protein
MLVGGKGRRFAFQLAGTSAGSVARLCVFVPNALRSQATGGAGQFVIIFNYARKNNSYS